MGVFSCPEAMIMASIIDLLIGKFERNDVSKQRNLCLSKGFSSFSQILSTFFNLVQYFLIEVVFFFITNKLYINSITYFSLILLFIHIRGMLSNAMPICGYVIQSIVNMWNVIQSDANMWIKMIITVAATCHTT